MYSFPVTFPSLFLHVYIFRRIWIRWVVVGEQPKLRWASVPMGVFAEPCVCNICIWYMENYDSGMNCGRLGIDIEPGILIEVSYHGESHLITGGEIKA